MGSDDTRHERAVSWDKSHSTHQEYSVLRTNMDIHSDLDDQIAVGYSAGGTAILGPFWACDDGSLSRHPTLPEGILPRLPRIVLLTAREREREERKARAGAWSFIFAKS